MMVHDITREIGVLNFKPVTAWLRFLDFTNVKFITKSVSVEVGCTYAC